MLRAFPNRATKIRGFIAVGVSGMALAGLASCSTAPVDYGPISDRRIFAPRGYNVDWDLPETDAFWVPPETKDDILTASQFVNFFINLAFFVATIFLPLFCSC